jgi:hypothetical protein
MQQWNVEHRVFAVVQFFLEITISLLLLQLFEKHAFFLRHPVQGNPVVSLRFLSIHMCSALAKIFFLVLKHVLSIFVAVLND